MQGTVSPASAKVVIKDGAGNQTSGTARCAPECQLLQGDGATAYFACSSIDAQTPENVPFTVTSHDCQDRLTILLADLSWASTKVRVDRHEHAGAHAERRYAARALEVSSDSIPPRERPTDIEHIRRSLKL